MKTLLCLLLCICMLFSYTSCLDDTQDPTPPSNDNTNENQTPGNENENGNEDETVSIDIYTLFEEERGALPYRLYIPDDYNDKNSYPVLIFLHGAGERGTDNTAQLKNVINILFSDPDSPVHDAIVIVPQCPKDQKWVNTPWENGSYPFSQSEESEALRGTLKILDAIKRTLSIDASRIYLMGISMGGFGTWDLLMRYPGTFAAAIPICGGADPTQMDRLVNVPIYTFHGDSDSVVPVDGTRAAVAAIREAGGERIIYEELPGVDHNSWDYAASKEGLMEWLFSQRAGQ